MAEVSGHVLSLRRGEKNQPRARARYLQNKNEQNNVWSS